MASNAKGSGGAASCPYALESQTSAQQAVSPPIRLISKRELLKRVPLSFPTIWKLIQQNRFPRAHVLGGKTVWIESEISNFLSDLPIREYKKTIRAAPHDGGLGRKPKSGG
jgi:predicted DNA-binding transcriptional regulator AlpA